MDFRRIRPDGERDVLQEDSLTGPWRRDNKSTLASPERRDQVHCSGADTSSFVVLEQDALIRKQRGKLIELLRLGPLFNRNSLDCDNFLQGHEFFLVARRPNEALYLMARTQTKSLQYRGRHVNVLRAGIEVKPRPTQEAVRFTRKFDHSLGQNLSSSGPKRL